MLAMEELLTPKDVSRILQMSVYTVKDMLREGELRGIKVRNEWRVRPGDLRAYIDQHPQNGQNIQEK